MAHVWFQSFQHSLWMMIWTRPRNLSKGQVLRVWFFTQLTAGSRRCSFPQSIGIPLEIIALDPVWWWNIHETSLKSQIFLIKPTVLVTCSIFAQLMFCLLVLTSEKNLRHSPGCPTVKTKPNAAHRKWAGWALRIDFQWLKWCALMGLSQMGGYPRIYGGFQLVMGIPP